MNTDVAAGKKVKVGVLLYTYNRIDDARINLEIIRNVWQKSELLKDVVVVNAFNGKKEWWPEKYLEDELLHLENPGHFSGAEILLNEGIKCFSTKHREVDYVIVLASDTWCVMPEYLEKVIGAMRTEEKYLAVCTWGTEKDYDMFKIGMSLDFNIVDIKWAVQYGLFPIRYSEFREKYYEVFSYEDKNVYPERVLALRFKEAIIKSVKIPSENLIKKVAQEHIYQMTEREPVHFVEKPILGMFGKPVQHRKMYWPDIGLITHHNPTPKQKAAKNWNLKLGKYGNRFLEANDLSYYNEGLTKIAYVNNGKQVHYDD